MKSQIDADTRSSSIQSVHLLRVADYLSRPQQFLAVAEARAGFRQMLEDASEQSVVLTNNGAPQAAVVPFETLEAMRGALLQILVGDIQTSFERLQREVAAQNAQSKNDAPEPTTEAELESLVGQARRRQSQPGPAKRRRR